MKLALCQLTTLNSGHVGIQKTKSNITRKKKTSRPIFKIVLFRTLRKVMAHTKESN